MPSFDIVSEIDLHEVSNAVEQAKKEILTRYDFKGAKAQFDLVDGEIILLADDKMKLRAMTEILNSKLAKRDVSLKSLDFKDATPAGGNMLRQVVALKQGLSSDDAKRIVKVIKGKKLKVSPAIQGEQVRVTGKKRDDLQEVIALLKQEVNDVELQFNNFRD